MCSGAQAAACSATTSPYALDCDFSGVTFTGGALSVSSTANLTGSNNPLNIKGNFDNQGIIIRSDQNPNSATASPSISISAVTINTFNNSKTIAGNEAVWNNNLSTINVLTNTGLINGGINTNTGLANPGINNDRSTNEGFRFLLMQSGTPAAQAALMADSAFLPSKIKELNNLQGGSSPLVYTGQLPEKYNIIINSPTNYGKLVITNSLANTPSIGLTVFGIHSSSTVTNGTYTSVLTGLKAPGNDKTFSPVLSSTSGTFGVGNWSLSLANALTNTWDLILSGFPVIILGPSAADTQQSLVNVAGGIKNTVTQQNTVVSNSLNYDCAVFDKKNACVSVSTRNTSSSADSNLNDTSGVIVGAIRPHPKLRVGLYVDQNSQSNPQGNAITISNNKPLVGFFAVWNQNADDSGIQIKLSAANGQKDTRITRPIIGTSEAGSGSTQLTSQGIQITAKYGFVVKKKGLIRPYLGMRFTENNVGKYTEASSSSVTAPLSYAGIYTNATTALAGVEFSYKFNPKFTLFASANLESDTNVTNGVISATGVSGLTPINLNSNPVKTRRSAIAGAYYDVAENQRIGLLGIYRQEPSQSESSTTAVATYHIGM
jgi:hypothetical protein